MLQFVSQFSAVLIEVVGDPTWLLSLIGVSFLIEVIKFRLQLDRELYENLDHHLSVSTSEMLPVPDAVQWVTIEWMGNRGTPVRWTCAPLKEGSTLAVGTEIVSDNMIGRVLKTHWGKP